MPNKLSQLWQELKRRKVTRVITVYAASAFVILELVDIIAEPLKLPEWFLTAVIIILCIGFIITVIVSWIYDIHPEGGIVKTEPARKAKPEDTVKSSNSWKIASYISFVVIVGLVVLNIISRSGRPSVNEILDKSIAVMPFLNLSGDPDQEYICEGLTGEIINNLYKIESINRVPSLTSVLNYRNSNKSVGDIATELKVNYILECQYKKLEEQLRFSTLLIEAESGNQIWQRDFDRPVNEISAIPSDIALQIADRLKAFLTVPEKQNVQKIPTLNQEAYNKYLQGKIYFGKSYDYSSMQTAVNLFKEAIALDPEFALAHTHLAMCYLSIYWLYYDRSQSLLIDSKKAIDTAIRIDSELPETYIALAQYYYHGFMDYIDALDQLNKASELMPQHPECSFITACVHRRMGDWEKAIEAFEAAHVNDPGSSTYTQDLAATYYMTGNYQKGLDLLDSEILRSPGTNDYYAQLIYLYLMRDGNTIKAREVLKDAAILNITETDLLGQSWGWFFPLNFYEGQYQNVLDFLSTSNFEGLINRNWYYPKSMFQAITNELMGSAEKARAYYDSTRMQLEIMLNKFPGDPRILGALGITYAGLGEKEKAIEAANEGVTKYSLEMDAFTGLVRIEELALTYIMVEEYDAALEQIEILLSNPGPYSAPLLKLDPRYKPLWDHPEFVRLTNIYAVK